MTGPDERPPWHGEPSLHGVGVGLLLQATVVAGAGFLLWPLLLAPPLVGGVLLALGGRSRQVGTGLVASALAVPLLVLSFWLVQGADVLTG